MSKYKVGDTIQWFDQEYKPPRSAIITKVEKGLYRYDLFHGEDLVSSDKTFKIEIVDKNTRKLTKLERALK